MPRMRISSILTVMLFVGVLALIEMASRFLLPQPEFRDFNRINYTQLVESPTGENVRPLQHVSFTIFSDPDNASFVHKLNLYGFRDRDWQSDKKERRVIFLGDSFVEGFMASQEETIPKGFEREATRGGMKLDVLNMGVNGAGIPDYLKLCRDAIPLFKPDDIIIVCYVNDFPPPTFEAQWLNVPPPPHRPLWYIPRIADACIRAYRNEPVPFAWNAAPFQYFAPYPAPANPWTKGKDSFEPFVNPDVASAMKAGRFNPFVVNEVFWNTRFLTMPFDVREHVSKLGEYTLQQNVRVWIAYIPCRDQLSDYYLQFARAYCMEDRVMSLKSAEYHEQAKALGAACKAAGIPFLNLTRVLKDREDSGKRQYWNYDSHMRGESYLFVGGEIWRWWSKYANNV